MGEMSRLLIPAATASAERARSSCLRVIKEESFLSDVLFLDAEIPLFLLAFIVINSTDEFAHRIREGSALY